MTEQNNNRDEAKQKNSSGNIGPILTLVFLGVVLLRCIFQLTEDGWDVVSKQNSGGALIFILACIAAYIVSAELIYTRVSKTVGKTMGGVRNFV